MIDNFLALSANERTYLAWIRTAISIVGFGILIDKFGASESDPGGSLFSALLVALGALLIAFAAARFLTINKRITSDKPLPAFSWRFNAIMVLLNGTLVILLILFAIHAI